MQSFIGGARLRAVVARATHSLLAVALCAAVLFSAAAGYAKIGVAYQMQLGNPSSATSTSSNHVNYLIQRDEYAMDYNDTRRVANWVSWDLTTEDVGGSGRSSFATDPGLPASFTIVGTGDYSGSGYDRGHMCPSADRTVDAANNKIVFYMTNMVPQTPDNNQGVWANFETYCRTIASQGNELLITCGGSHYSGSTIASGVAIPGYVWKIVLVVPTGTGMAIDRVTTATRVIAIRIPNISGVRSDSWTNYVTSIAQIEADTGFTFLTALPSATANVLRTKVDGQTVSGMPVIATHPSSQTVTLGGSVTFSVSATGDAPLSYQWSKDDVEIPGETGTSLTFNPVEATDTGSYTVTVSNNVGSTTSSAAVLDITGIAPSITTAPTAQTVSAGTTAIFNVVANGSATLSYQWRKNTQSLTNGGNVSGATSATLTLTNVQSADAALYDVIVTNSVSSATSTATALQVNAAAPTIVTPPTATSVIAGSTATFTVAARGTTPLTYQWSKDGIPLANAGNISGATSATLSVANVSETELGNYTVTISNGVGLPATSAAAALTLKTILPGQVAYSGGSYTQNFDTLPTSGTFALSGAGPHAFDSAPFNAMDLGGWHLAKFGGTGTNALFNISTGTSNTGSAFSFGVAGANPISDRALGTISSNSTISRFGLVLVNTTGRTISQFTLSYIGEQWRNGGNTAAQSLSFEYSVGATSVNAGTFNPAAVLNFTSPTVGSTAGALDGNANANRTAISATVTGLTWGAGQTLVLRWTDANDSGNDHALAIDDFSFSTPDPAPTITVSPTSRSVALGASTTLSVTASGNALTYQWRKGEQPISGNATATTAALVLSNVTLADAGDYDVVVTNSGGSATSSAATVTVLSAQQSWRQTHFGSTDNTGNAADAADPDGDGVANVLEYVLGSDPNAASAAALPTGALESSSFAFRYNRALSATDVTVTVQKSTDLVTWSTVATTVESSTASAETLLASVSATQSKEFFRLVADSVATVPVGYMNFTLTNGRTLAFGVPFDDPAGPLAGIKAGKVAAFTATTLTHASGGWTSGVLGAAAAPWAVRFTSGNAAGKLVDIANNTATTLTLKNTDLTALGVAVGDTFELVAIDTLGTLFGSATLQGGTSTANADNVQIRSGATALTYFYDTALGYWRRSTTTANASDATLRPGSGFAILRRGATKTVTVTGRVLGCTYRQPIANAGATTLTHGFPIDTTLGALAFQTRLSGWRSGTTTAADQLYLHNGTTWVGYVYNGSHWIALSGGANSDTIVVPAGALLLVQRPGATAGTTDFVFNLPY